jgi:hypothetical protein
MFIVLEVLCVMLFGMTSEPPNFGPAILRFVARYGSALGLCILLTGVVVWLEVAILR